MAITKISSALIGANTIATANIADNAIDGTKIAQNSILTKHIDDAQVTADQLAADAVITAKILDANVTSAKIADDAVTLAKLAGLARGKIIYGDASGNPAALALGSNGTVLKSDGTDIAWGTDATVAALTSEEVQDIAGAMFSSNTETGITATYQDGDGTIDLVVGTLNQDTTGSAATLTTARTIGGVSFNGSANIDLPGVNSVGNQNTTGTAATVTTAAQPNITSLGTLTTLTVDNVIINGTTIGHTSDTDLLTLTSGVLTVAGEVDATSLDISGDADIDGTLEADAITIGGVTLAETISDTVGAMVSSNTETNITVTYEDSDNTLDFVIGTLNQDTTGLAGTATALATARTIHGVSFDGTANIDLTEVVQDTVGAMVSSNTESGITVAYQDGDGTLDFTVGTLNQNTTGSAATLTTARAIAVAGAVTGTANFDGSAGISISTTLANNAVLTQHIDDNQVTTDQIAANTIATGNIADNAVDGTKIASNSILTRHIDDNQVTTDQIAANTIATANIADNAVDGTKIASNSILTRHIDDDQVTGAQLADAVTFVTSATAPLTVSTTSARITQVALTSSSNAVAWDAAAAANAYHVTTENTTFSAPSNAVEGAIISVELAQGGTARTIGWNTVFEFAASTAPTVTATASKTDIFSFRYNGSVWQEIGRVQNMAQT